MGYAHQPTSKVPCGDCGGDTIPPTPGRAEEVGYYCEGCGYVTHTVSDPGLDSGAFREAQAAADLADERGQSDF